jgi:hypothetical protein
VGLLLTCSVVRAQDDNNGNWLWGGEDKGPTVTETFSGSSNSISGMLKADTSLGWNFSRNFGVEVGVPYLLDTRPGIFAGTSGRIGYVNYPYISCTYFFGCYYGVATSSRLWAGELGDVYADAHYTRTYRKYDFSTVLTADTPTASFRKGLTTGRLQADWFNHVDVNVHDFTPFVNFGLANGRMDQHFMPRPFDTDLPFTTLGFMSDWEGGVSYNLWHHIGIGASVWDVLPTGPQKIYSNLVWDQPGSSILVVGSPSTSAITTLQPSATGLPGNFGYLVGDPNHGRYWNTAFETTGPAYIARDNGFSGTVSFSPSKYMDIQIGYNHSVRYHLDDVVFTVAFKANSLFRKATRY